MHQQFEVRGTPPKQALVARLNDGRMVRNVYVSPSNQSETGSELQLRAQREVRAACPLGVVGCESRVELAKTDQEIIDPNTFCFKAECPFQDGGGSGDREILNSPLPSGELTETVRITEPVL